MKAQKLFLLALLFICINLVTKTNAQIQKDQAIDKIKLEIVGADTTNFNIYLNPTLINSGYYKLSPYDSIFNPYDTA